MNWLIENKTINAQVAININTHDELVGQNSISWFVVTIWCKSSTSWSSGRDWHKIDEYFKLFFKNDAETMAYLYDKVWRMITIHKLGFIRIQIIEALIYWVLDKEQCH